MRARRSSATTRERSERLNIVHQLLRAHALYEKDVNYVVQDGQVLIVDEFTGRTMPGRRWSEGLHQAVEAKEGVQVKGETQTMATITIQNYFRMYEKLVRHDRYGRDGGDGVPRDLQARSRGDSDEQPDRFATTGRTGSTRRGARSTTRSSRRRSACTRSAFRCSIGTTSVDVSETLARMFQRAGIKHNVLNAKYHQREAEIVAGAGQPGAVTIATNMAGRGTDIKLGDGRHRLEAVGGEGSGGEDARRRGGAADCTSSAPSATSRGASIASCAAARDVRAIRARRSSSSRSKTT